MSPEIADVDSRPRAAVPRVLRRARIRAAGFVAALATAATLIGFAQTNKWIELWDGAPDRDEPVPGATSTPPPDDPTSTPPTSGGGGQERLLAELPPVVGAAQLVPLRGGADAAVSLGLRCAAGTTQDRSREVRYRLTAPYERLTAQVVTSGVDDPEAAVQVEVLSGPVVAETLVVRGNSSTPLAAELTDDLEVGLRLTCQRPGGFVVITRPTLLRRG